MDLATKLVEKNFYTTIFMYFCTKIRKVSLLNKKYMTCKIAFFSFFLFSQFSIFAQESYPILRKIHFEVNGGTGLFRSHDFFPVGSSNDRFNSPSNSNEGLTNHTSFNFSSNLYCKNYRLKGGIGFQMNRYNSLSIHNFSYFTSVNLLPKTSYPNSFFGPFISHSFQRVATGNMRYQMGADFYYKQLHIGYRHEMISVPGNTYVGGNQNDYIEIGYAFKIG